MSGGEGASGPRVVGREAELAVAEDFLSDARRGLAALRFEGDAGIGKTTLWQAAVARAAELGARLLVTRPAEAEARLSFAGLTDLVGAVEGEALRGVPGPQRHALEVALLRAEPGPGGLDDRALTAGLMTLLRALSEASPVVVAVDDAQWLDAPTAEALTFALRRLDAAPVGLVVSVRTSAEVVPCVDTAVERGRRRVVTVGPLSLGALQRLVRDRLGISLPRPVLVRVEEASAGNPLHALEIARALRDSGDVRGADVVVPDDVRNLMTNRIRRLPEPTRDALLVAAALSRPTTALVSEEALLPAEDDDVVRIEGGGAVRFTHPLLAATVYDRAAPEARRAVHRALAGSVADAEERARHLALAAEGPDEDVAASLHVAAEVAAARGAARAAVDLIALSIALTPEGRDEVVLERRLRHAEGLLRVGDSEAARAILADVLDAAPPGDLRGRAVLAAAKLDWFADIAGGRALLQEALAGVTDPVLAARMHARLSWMEDRVEPSLAEARAGLALITPEDDPVLHAYLDLQRAMCEFAQGTGDDGEAVRRAAAVVEASPWEMSPVPYTWARLHDDVETCRAVALRALELARAHGDVGAEAHASATLGVVAALTGDPRTGLRLTREAMDVAEAADLPILRIYVRGILVRCLVMLGRLDEAREAIAAARADLSGYGAGVPTAAYATAAGAVCLLDGDAAQAVRELTVAADLLAGLGDVQPRVRFEGDLTEALIATGDLDRAEALVASLEQRAERFGVPWVVCVSLRYRGLLAAARGDLPAARDALARALDAHAALPIPEEHGRTLLAAGRVERRARQWGPARRLLEQAIEVLAGCDARGWLVHAEAELARVAARPPARADGLSETERQVAGLVAEGLTNREIADALFQSPKTVEAHLTRIYRKAGVRSRTELAAALRSGGLGD